MTSARKLKKRTAARIADKMLYALIMNPEGGNVGLTVFQSRRSVATIQLSHWMALQLSAAIAEAATGRRAQ